MAKVTTILTTYGNNQILQAMADDTNVQLSAMVYGDGGGETYTPNPSQTSLVNQLGSVIDLTKTYDSEDGFIYFNATIPANIPECTIRELGLVDLNNKLIAVSVIPATSKPAAEEGLEISLPISIGFKTSTGEVMIVYVDGGSEYAKKEWVKQKIASIKVIRSTNW